MGEWIMGCDICQDVCPWNRKSPATDNDVFRKQEIYAPLDVRWLLSLSDDVFKQTFGTTPLSRPGRKGIIRNALIALGNRFRSDLLQGDRFRSELLQGDRFRSELLHGNKRHALENINEYISLVSALLGDDEPLIRGAAVWALSQSKTEVAFNMMRERLPREFDLYVLDELFKAIGLYAL